MSEHGAGTHEFGPQALVGEENSLAFGFRFSREPQWVMSQAGKGGSKGDYVSIPERHCFAATP